jgi:hypothetical protein
MSELYLHSDGNSLLVSDAGQLTADPNCCCGSGRVLIWTGNSSLGGEYSVLQLSAVYQNMGLMVDVLADLGNHLLSDYGLIHWLAAVSDPPWWPEITGGTWSGRLHLTGEHDAFGGGTAAAYVAGLSGVTGISVTADGIDSGCSHDGSVESDALTAGCTVIKYAMTSQVSGGATLSKTATGSNPWLARNKVGNIDFVVAGDSNHAIDGCSVVDANKKLFENMWNVAV